MSEASGGGVDTVEASVTYTLPENVENLTLTGYVNINGTGNTLSNTLTGNSGNNVLVGMDGNDSVGALQFAPQAMIDDTERGRLAPYAAAFDAEFLQLCYQIAIHGRDEIGLAPDESSGFAMTLLRLFAFRPDAGAPSGVTEPSLPLEEKYNAPTQRR